MYVGSSSKSNSLPQLQGNSGASEGKTMILKRLARRKHNCDRLRSQPKILFKVVHCPIIGKNFRFAMIIISRASGSAKPVYCLDGRNCF